MGETIRKALALASEWKWGLLYCIAIALPVFAMLFGSYFAATLVLFAVSLPTGSGLSEVPHELAWLLLLLWLPLTGPEMIEEGITFHRRQRQQAEEEDLGLDEGLKQAIIDQLSDKDLRMPSSLVGALRKEFAPARVRPALEYMFRNKELCRRNHAYCLPGHVNDIRRKRLRSLLRYWRYSLEEGRSTDEFEQAILREAEWNGR